MVKIHYKKTDTNQFLYECASNTPIDVLIQDLVYINNMRVTIDHLSMAIEGLATHGIVKPEALRGLTTKDVEESAYHLLSEEEKKQVLERPKVGINERFNEDKTAYRFGVILNEQTTNIMLQEVEKAKRYISKNKVVQFKEIVTKKEIKEVLDCLRGAVMIAYPAYHGLPSYEPARTILEEKFDFENMQSGNIDWLVEKDTQLWWAGKELMRGKILSDYTGKNEKTKIIVKMQKSGQGAPVREPPVDEETQKKMMSFYYKKQEEMKQLEEDTDDNYMNQPWANSQNLKNQLIGGDKQISWKGH